MQSTSDLELREKAAEVHGRSIIIDACGPLLGDLANAKYWIEGGATCSFATMGLCGDDIRSTVLRIAKWHQQLLQYKETVTVAASVEEIRRAKAEGKFAVVLALQNSSPLEYDTSMVGLMYRLGIRAMILAYNRAEAAGDGCMELRNGGLTWFGREVIKEMNRVGMLVDVSHCGERTSLEAIEASAEPVAFTHAGAKAIFDHPRNLTDEQIRAVSTRDGMIGINGHALFVKDTPRPTVEDLLDHYDHVINLAGIDHVGMGFDFSQLPDAQMPAARYQMLMSTGVWREGTLPPPPWFYPIETAAGLPQLTEGLLRRGYSEGDVEKVLGGNFLKLFERVWKPVE